MLYKVHLKFDDVYEIEADNEYEAVDEALDMTKWGEWNINVEEND